MGLGILFSLIASRWLSISSYISTQAGGKNCLPYSMEVSPLLEALVLIGSNFTLSFIFSVSWGDVRPLYIPSLPGVPVPTTFRKLLFRGRNLKMNNYVWYKRQIYVYKEEKVEDHV